MHHSVGGIETKSDKIMSKVAAQDGGVVFTPMVRKTDGTRRHRNAVRVVTTASNCPYDALEYGKIPCRCNNKFELGTRCDKCHHKIFFGAQKTVVLGSFIPLRLQKTVVLGSFIPLRLQEDVGSCLAKLDSDTQIVSIIVDMKEEGKDAMLGEIQTLLAINEIDVEGAFTSKLIFQQELLFDKNDKTMQIVDNNLFFDENGKAPTPKEQMLHERMQKRIRHKSDLYCICMVYAGYHMGYALPVGTGKTNVYTAYKNLLENYQTLSREGICHLDMHRENVTWGFDSNDQLAFKIIDFGYNKVYIKKGQPQMDVTKHFMQVCNVVKDSLREFHPVEYPILLLHPIFVPHRNWDITHHRAKLKVMLAFTSRTTAKQFVACKWKAQVYASELPNSATELHGLWCKIWVTYAKIEDILLSKWTRVCKIVGEEIAQRYFQSDGNCVSIRHPPVGLQETSHHFTNSSHYIKSGETSSIQKR